MPIIFADGFDYYPTVSGSIAADSPMQIASEVGWSSSGVLSTNNIRFEDDPIRDGKRLAIAASTSHISRNVPSPDASNDLVIGWRIRSPATANTSNLVRIGTASITNATPAGVVLSVSILWGTPARWQVTYNGSTTTITDVEYLNNNSFYMEAKFTTSGCQFRINGVEVFSSASAPSSTITRMRFSGHTTSGTGTLYDDVYIAYGENEQFYGPLQIEDLAVTAEVVNSGFSTTAIDVLTAISSSTVSVVATSTAPGSQYILRGNVDGIEGYIIMVGSRSRDCYPITLTTMHGEDISEMVDLETIRIQTEYMRYQWYYDANSLVISSNPVDVDGEYRLFGFRINDIGE